MERTRSPIRTAGNHKRQQGVTITNDDRRRLALLGRWYCLSADAIARTELHPRYWSPAYEESETPDAQEKYAKHIYAVRRRLTRIKHIERNPGLHLGPFADSAMVHEGLTAWFATRVGGTAATLPWAMRSSINPLLAAHAWMAADIGIALETEGYRVLSERELSTGLDRWGSVLEARLESTYSSPKGLDTKKKPDVVVLAPNGKDYIAIEAERDMSRSVKVYEEKLRAYRNNSSIKAVWYICSNHTTAKRVAEGATRVFGSGANFPLRLFVTKQPTGFHFFDVPNLPGAMAGDLKNMQPQTENNS